MNRRKLLMGLGGLAGAGSLVGTGAFSSVQAQRTVSVNVDDDQSALLALEPATGPNSAYAVTSGQNGGGQLQLDFTGENTLGSGLATDSTYRFDNVFTVTNQGTQSVGVWLSVGSDTPFDDDSMWFYPQADDSVKLQGEGEGVVELDPGQSTTLGLQIDTTGLDIDEWDVNVTVHADASVDGVGISCPTTGANEVLVSKDSDCGQFSAIQPAVDAAADDDTIDTVVVDAGTYADETFVTVRDTALTITSAGSGRPDIRQNIRSAPSNDTLTLSGLQVTDKEVVVIGDTNTVTVDDCHLLGQAATDGIKCTGQSDDDELGTLSVVQSELRGNNWGVRFEGDTYNLTTLELSGTLIRNSNGYALRSENDGALDIETATIDNCEITKTDRGGVRLGDVQTLSVTGSLFEEPNRGYFEETGLEVNAATVTIEDSTFSTYSAAEIRLGGADIDANIARTAVENPQDGYEFSGIIVGDSSVEGGSTVDVSIEESNFTGIDEYGIELLSSASGNVTATGCYFDNGDDDQNVDEYAANDGVTVTNPESDPLSVGYDQ